MEALLAVHTGYLNLAASASTLAGLHLVGLESVPLFTTVVALALQLVPAVLLASADVWWLRRPLGLAGALMVLLAPRTAEEVRLNTITSQFHQLLALALVLVLPPSHGRVIATFRATLALLGPLSAPGAAFLLPLFWLRAGLGWSRPRLVEAALLTLGVGVQAAVALSHPEPARSAGIGLSLLASVIGVKHILLPLLPKAVTDLFVRSLIPRFPSDASAEFGVLLPAVIVGTVLAFTAMIVAALRTTAREPRWFLAAGLILAACSYSFALTIGRPDDLLRLGFGGRYAYAPTVLFGLTLLGLAADGPFWARWPASILVAWALILGLAAYPRVNAITANGPDWLAEIAAWRRDPDRPVAVWPGGIRPMHLDPAAHPSW
jgi:hypothetical protein